jgi:hypothetical protein
MAAVHRRRGHSHPDPAVGALDGEWSRLLARRAGACRGQTSVVLGTDAAQVEFLSGLWRGFAEREAGTYSPLYSAIARTVADDPGLLGRIIEDVPRAGHLPIALLAAVHDLVLRGTDHQLGEAYQHQETAAAPGLFVGFCDTHWEALVDLLRRRRVQTNECGRSAPIALALAKVIDAVGPLTALVDAGASAGLNLLYDRFCLDYGPLGILGDPTSAVHARCDVTASGYRLPDTAPTIPQRIGLDRAPIDVSDDDDRRWLLACVWPDTGRLERTAAALRIAAADPPDVRRGDMIADLASTIDTVPASGPVCVMTSWAVGYLSRPAREEFAAVLTEVGMRRPIVWLSLEMSGVVDSLDAPGDVGGFDIEPCVVGLTRFEHGARRADVLGLVHPHGRALRWL